MEMFVVELWEPDRDVVLDDVRGVVKAVSSGRTHVFRTGEELLKLLRSDLPLRE